MAELDEAHDTIKKCSVEDHYDLIEEIGQGQYASVHRAEHKETGKLVAVKLIDKGDTGMTVTDKEIAVMLRVEDENCVRLYEVYETETEVQMVLELLEGADLFDRIIQKQKYPEAEAKVLMARVCKGVKHLHEKNIMHRDLKPENILLASPDDDVLCKVGDLASLACSPRGLPVSRKLEPCVAHLDMWHRRC